MRTYGQAGHAVAARNGADIPLTARPSGRDPITDLHTRGSHRQTSIPLTPAPETAPARPRQERDGVIYDGPIGPRGAPVHGITGYTNGCRCETCRDAKRVEGAKYRAARKARQAGGAR